jgi:DNA-binding transcriptional regulator YiaG
VRSFKIRGVLRFQGEFDRVRPIVKVGIRTEQKIWKPREHFVKDGGNLALVGAQINFTKVIGILAEHFPNSPEFALKDFGHTWENKDILDNDDGEPKARPPDQLYTLWNIGHAHYFRGLLLYRANDFLRAESEFSLAGGSRLTEVPQGDVAAWRAMSVAAGAGCKAPLDALEAAAKTASDQFPKAEAEALIFDCRLKQASTLDQYLALEKTYAGRLAPAKLGELRNLIASGYTDQGVAAEDRKDPYSAVVAYRHALEWNPANAKARFNLGAIYIEDKRYNLAEAEYRALVEADASDHEAHYWLAQSILAQRPPAERVQEACELLRHSLAIPDPQKKAQFAKAFHLSFRTVQQWEQGATKPSGPTAVLLWLIGRIPHQILKALKDD